MTPTLAECRARTPIAKLRGELAESEFVALSSLADSYRARSRAHAYILIRRLLRVQPSEVTIAYDPDGRPRADGAPCDISISHAEDLVAVAVAGKGYRVGIDIEPFNRQIDAGAFTRFLLTGAEQLEFERMRMSGWSVQEAVIGVWSAKESFCKCAGYAFRPADLSLHWSADFRDAVVSPEPRLQHFLDNRGLAAERITLNRNGSRVLTVTVMTALE